MPRIALPSAVQSALDQVKEALTSIYGDKLSGVYLYGSYARGDFREGSDVDLMIALKGEITPGEEVNRLSRILSDICLRYNLLIATYPVSDKWIEERQSPLFVNVRREGVRL
ncbi:MAG TPA: nucleotidyltransferase domain-containing protein [Anaerolineae bacterium]|nr:nucleotidyltransferase domain-containing protein [Anaerolineae bacterium]